MVNRLINDDGSIKPLEKEELEKLYKYLEKIDMNKNVFYDLQEKIKELEEPPIPPTEPENPIKNR